MTLLERKHSFELDRFFGAVLKHHNETRCLALISESAATACPACLAILGRSFPSCAKF